MIENFINTFSFEDDLSSIEETLQITRKKVFEEVTLPVKHQPKWAIQMEYALECYNIATEDSKDEEDPRNIDIPETKGEFS